jgi:hypothetical protein
MLQLATVPLTLKYFFDLFKHYVSRTVSYSPKLEEKILLPNY